MENVVSEKSISEGLRIVLIKKGLNVSKLADLVGVSKTTMYSKFNRESFTSRDLDKICKALNITYKVSFILDDDSVDTNEKTV